CTFSSHIYITYSISLLSVPSFLLTTFIFSFFFFFFNDTATTEIYTLSLHDALPISIRTDHPADQVDRQSTQSVLVSIRLECFAGDRKSTRLNSSHVEISYAVFCLKKKKKTK